jgi:ribosome biogenesis GTPase / thiamine phosphate phosphatase
VAAVDRGRYGCVLEDHADPVVDGRLVTAMKARELGKGSVVVGDRVALAGDVTGSTGSLARIVRVEERTSVLRRSPDDTDPLERVVVANADQLVIVSALADPEPSFGLIDRCLVAALSAGIEPVLCLTKSDLASPDAVLAQYAPLSVPALVTRRGGPLDELREHLAGKASVLVGHSGVGKSTLINALVPTASRAIGVVSAIGKGRHTSSSAVALALPGGGWVIDTPGVRSFGLAHVSADDLLWAFPDLEDGAVQCLSGCEHLSAEAGCHLDQWVREGHAAPARLAAFRQLLVSR